MVYWMMKVFLWKMCVKMTVGYALLSVEFNELPRSRLANMAYVLLYSINGCISSSTYICASYY